MRVAEKNEILCLRLATSGGLNDCGGRGGGAGRTAGPEDRAVGFGDSGPRHGSRLRAAARATGPILISDDVDSSNSVARDSAALPYSNTAVKLTSMKGVVRLVAATQSNPNLWACVKERVPKQTQQPFAPFSITVQDQIHLVLP